MTGLQDPIEPRGKQFGPQKPVQQWVPGDDSDDFLGSVALEKAVFNPEGSRLVVNLTRSAFDNDSALGQQFTFPATALGEYAPDAGTHTVVVDASNLAPYDRASNFEQALYDLFSRLSGVVVWDQPDADAGVPEVCVCETCGAHHIADDVDHEAAPSKKGDDPRHRIADCPLCADGGGGDDA